MDEWIDGWIKPTFEHQATHVNGDVSEGHLGGDALIGKPVLRIGGNARGDPVGVRKDNLHRGRRVFGHTPVRVVVKRGRVRGVRETQGRLDGRPRPEEPHRVGGGVPVVQALHADRVLP